MKRRNFLQASALLGLPLTTSTLLSNTPVQASWSRAASLPIKIQELYPCVHKGELYVAGGIAAKLGLPYFTNRFFRYEPDRDQWFEETNLPEDLHHAALVSTTSRLFLVGGFNGGYTHIWRMRDRVYEYVDNTWQARTSLPVPQAEGVLTHRAGQIHLVGGQRPKSSANKARSDHLETTTHLVWEPGQAEWETLAPIPLARNSATGGWVDSQLVISGGRNAEGNFSQTHIYDLQEDRWRDAAPMPLPQAGTASAAVDDGIIVFGGEIFVPDAGVFKNVWRYELSRDRWIALDDLPTPRHGLGAGLIDNKIYVIGGATEPSGKGTSSVNEV